MVKKFYMLLLFMLFAAAGHTQCNGSLGTPILDETFGSGTSRIGPPLPAGITTLIYDGNTCPEDGYYAIVNYTTGCFGEWHTLTDHTGDPNGYFMLIDANFQPSDFFVQTVNGLCDGTTYNFSAWIINMFHLSGGTDPDITFTIEKTDGTVLKSFDTGAIDYSTDVLATPAQWSNFGFYFTTPAGVSTVVLRMHNNAPGGQGNDLGLDDISFTPAGPKTSIAVDGIKGNTATVLCSNKTTITSTVGSCYAKNGYQWQISTDGTNFSAIPGANNPAYTVNLPATGKYYYRLNVAESDNIGNPNCSANSNVYTVVYNPPQLSNLNASICAGTSYILPSGKSVSAAGAYIDTLRTSRNCDSVVTYLNLVLKPLSFSTVKAAICQGQNYLGFTKTGVYTDTLSAKNGCDSIINLTLAVNPISATTLNIGICNGDSYLGHSTTGIYTDTLTAANGCDSLVTLHLTVNPYVSLGGGKSFCYGDSVILVPGLFIHYLWQDGSTTPTYTVKNGGYYSVTVTDEDGCMAADTVYMHEIGCLPATIPNTFTPNGDGINDTWNIQGLEGYTHCTVFIYTRWGQQVFSSTGYSKPWDGKYNGKQLAAGVYYYVIDLNNNTPNISGYVTIIR